MHNLGLKCPNCGGDVFERDESRGELVCTKCGMVLEDNIDYRNEVRMMEEDDMKRNRMGPPTSVSKPDRGLYTTFNKWGRMKWINDSVCGVKNKKFQYAIYRINTIAQQLRLPKDVINRACYLYRHLTSTNKMKGKNIDYVAPVVVLLSAYEMGRYMPPEEIVKKYRLNNEKFDRTYFTIKKEFKFGDIPDIKSIAQYALVKLNADACVREETYEIINKVLQVISISSKSKRSIVGGSIAIAMEMNNEPVVLNNLCEILHINRTTLRKRIDEIREYLTTESN